MTNHCSEYTDLIDRSRFEELDAAEEAILRDHLGSCESCSNEAVRLDRTLSVLKGVEETPVPRHFQIQPESAGLAGMLRDFLRTPWKLGLTGAAAMLLLTVSLVASQIQVHAQDGAMTIGFGDVAARSEARLKAIRADLVALVEQEVTAKQAEALKDVRSQLSKATETLEDRQSQIVDQAMGQLRLAISDQVSANGEALEEHLADSAEQIYKEIVRQVSADVTYLNNRLDLLAVQGQIQSSQSDALVETLLQIADARLEK